MNTSSDGQRGGGQRDHAPSPHQDVPTTGEGGQRRTFGDAQWVSFAEGDRPDHDRLVVGDDTTNARIAVPHSSWQALAAAVEGVRVAHCSAAGCSPATTPHTGDRGALTMPPGAVFAPTVRFITIGDNQFDALMTWRADLEMAYADEDDTPMVFVGYADFLTIRTRQDSIADLLDALSVDAAHFAVLFDGDDVNPVVQEQFRDAPQFNQVLIFTKVVIAYALQDHDLGAWLVAEVIARMANATDTLVLLNPFTAVHQTADTAELDAVNKLAEYWQRAGLVHIHSDPEFLGQSTAFTALPLARRQLRTTVEGGQIAIPEQRLQEWTGQFEPRYTLLNNSNSAPAAAIVGP